MFGFTNKFYLITFEKKYYILYINSVKYKTHGNV